MQLKTAEISQYIRSSNCQTYCSFNLPIDTCFA